jgi:hypothetical protein
MNPDLEKPPRMPLIRPEISVQQSILVGLLLTFSILGFRRFPAEVSKADSERAILFEELPSKVTGIAWVHDNAMSPERHLPETTGSGCAFFDYNNDGWLDIFLVNSGVSDFFAPKSPLKNALYRNNRDGTFTDVTDPAGLSGGRFGMGVAVGDYDNDGWQDLYVTNYGHNYLYHNRGDGTFLEVAKKAGVDLNVWSTSAVWFDYDNDGRLDLFVCNYVYYERALSRLCHDESQRARYCIPRLFKPTPSRLYWNKGDGTFADVSTESGIGGVLGKAFGVVATDVNNDRMPDLFVANDMVANFLFVNQGKGKFEEVGLWSGVGYSEAGSPRSGMGADATDFDGDGWQDLFVANVDHQRFSLYRNLKDLTFREEPGEIARDTLLLSGWGLRFFDCDNDGDSDLFLANGHPDDMVDEVNLQVKYKEPLLLFENRDGIFKNISAHSGSIFAKDFPARGLATGDVDNDGDLDVLINVNGQSPLLLRNSGGDRHHWIGLKLVATKSNPAAVGALITWRIGERKRSRLKTSGGSYLSWHDPREILGLGPATKIDELEIRWPSGQVDRVLNPPVDTYVELREGSGTGSRQLPKAETQR